jgi:hypothetical protein
MSDESDGIPHGLAGILLLDVIILLSFDVVVLCRYLVLP